MASTAESSRQQTHSPAAVALVVSTDSEQRDLLLQALRARGLLALASTGSRETLALMDQHAVAVLVIDADLGGLSGFDLARLVRRHGRGASASLIITTDVRWSPQQKAAAIQQMGLLELLTKPLALPEVVELVAGTLSAWSQSEARDAEPQGEPVQPAVLPAPAAEPAEALVERSSAVEQTERAALAELGQLADPASHVELRQVERATRAAQAGTAELRGNLMQLPFPRLLHELYRKRATGALFLLSEGIKKIVYFRDGNPTYIKSNRLTECLGKVLMREGMINEAQCRESLRRMAETTRQQGTVLIEMGAITPHDLVVALELQLRAKLMEIFAWSRGEFFFQRDVKLPADVISLSISNATLIADGIRTCWEQPRLEEALEPALNRYLVPNPDAEMRFQELAFEPEEQAWLDSVDGAQTLRQLLAASALPTRKTLAVAYTLLITDVVLPQEVPLAHEPAGEAALAAADESEALRERLAAELRFLRQRDAFGVLGVLNTASDREVHHAYSILAREYHPDRYCHEARQTQRLAQELFRLVNEAYAQLSSVELRRSYLEPGSAPESEASSSGASSSGASSSGASSSGASSSGASSSGASSSGALEAEQLKKQALELIAAEEWAEARQLLCGAVALCGDVGDLHALLGWATYRAEPENAAVVRAGIRELRKAIILEPRLYAAYLYLGRIYAAMGKTILAEKQFEKALQCNPDGVEALDELKLQQDRRPPRRYRF